MTLRNDVHRAALSVLDETAETTISALQGLFLEHGPPLALKSDSRHRDGSDEFLVASNFIGKIMADCYSAY